MEEIRKRAIVHNDASGQIATKEGQVLHVVALVLSAGLAEEPVANNAVLVQLVQQRISIPKGMKETGHTKSSEKNTQKKRRRTDDRGKSATATTLCG
tara:strand:+ start:198 stop:488 length:291 start_codon:yes stop_codon:yes gene_type:complete